MLDGDALQLRVGERAAGSGGVLAGTALCVHHGLESGFDPAFGHRQRDRRRWPWCRSWMPSAWPVSPHTPTTTDGEWREPGWLVMDLDEQRCSNLLAREFGQAGVLDWAFGEPVRLRMLLPSPRAHGAAAHIDWVPEPAPATRLKPSAIA